VAEKWREAGNPSVNTHKQDYRHWGSAYRDPTLDRLVEIAYEQNLSLMEAGARVLTARASLGHAIGELYPQTQQLSGTGDYLQPSRTDATSNPSDTLATQFWRVNLGARGSLICGASSAMALNPPMPPTWRRSPPMTTCSSP
jgi:outer membrane protein TolC